MQPSKDGYLRLPASAFAHLNLQHLVSGLDDLSTAAEQRLCGGPTVISGYTEWVCDTEPGLSVGWDWLLEVRDGVANCTRIGLPYSNLMLIDEDSHDVGVQKTLHSLAKAIDALAWNDATHRSVLAKYSN